MKRVALVGDRGLITSARIEEELQPAGLDWITALRAPAYPDARGRRRPAAAVAVRRARSGRDRKPGLSGRAPRRLPQPGVGRGTRASEANCSPPPSGSSSASRPAFAALASRSRALPPSARRSVPCSAAARSPSTSASPSATTILRLPAMTPASPSRRRSTASMSCAPPCRPRPSMPAPPCARIRAWLRSSAPSVR